MFMYYKFDNKHANVFQMKITSTMYYVFQKKK